MMAITSKSSSYESLGLHLILVLFWLFLVGSLSQDKILRVSSSSSQLSGSTTNSSILTQTAIVPATPLPSLSERSNGGLNSRYLSASSSSASLASATVAAANALAQASNAGPSSVHQINNINQAQTHGSAIGHHGQAQQQATQQQQQLNQLSTGAQTSIQAQVQAVNVANQNNNNINGQQQQLNTIWGHNNNNINTNNNNNQPQQQGRQSPVVNSGIAGVEPQTPVLSSTFVAYNPSTTIQQTNSDNIPSYSSNYQQPAISASNSRPPYQPGGPTQFSGGYHNPITYGNNNNQYNQLHRFASNNNNYYNNNNNNNNNNPFQRRVSSLSGAISRPPPGGSSSVVYQQQQQPAISNLLDIDNNNVNDLGLVPFSNNAHHHQNQQATNNIINTNDLPTFPFATNTGLASNSYQAQLSSQQQQNQYQDPQQQLQLPQQQHSIFATNSPNGVEYRYQDQCLAADNRHGTCYQASECIRRGGTPMGRCGSTLNANSGPDPFLTSSVCCIFDVTCGQFAAERFVYFRNPNYPQPTEQSRMCRAKIGKLDKGVCQFRLDLQRFDVAKPSNGNCSHDMFVVSGQNENYVIPKICGLNDGQHYYVGVDESGVITLHMMMMGSSSYYRRSFEILITQIPCRSDFAAPAHCLQYYVGTHGTIKSFNYEDTSNSLISGSGGASDNGAGIYGLESNDIQSINSINHHQSSGWPSAPYGLQFGHTNSQLQHRQAQSQYPNFAAINGPYQPGARFGAATGNSLLSQQDQFAGYPNDLDYTMCIRKESGFCSITYQLSRSDAGQSQPFAIGNNNNWLNNNNNNFNIENNNQWHQVSTECRDDYLLIGGVRLCSGQNNNIGNGLSTQLDHTQFGGNLPLLNGTGSVGGYQQIQQLQNQHTLVLQQLARIQQLQQQQQQLNTSLTTNINNNNHAVNLQQLNSQLNSSSNNNSYFNNNNNNNNNLDQQQASLLQQAAFLQQQIQSSLANANNNPIQQQQQSINNRYPQQGSDPLLSGFFDSTSNIITDNTPGPFILRFVSNIARNARGFHIDYRQNPCK